jgi:hypothetical protein
MKCPSSGKECHSRGVAEAHLRDLKDKRDYIGHAYFCEPCGFWHVGREKQGVHTNKYRRVA